MLLLQALLQELRDAPCAAGNCERQELIAANVSQLNTDPKREGRRDEGEDPPQRNGEVVG